MMSRLILLLCLVCSSCGGKDKIEYQPADVADLSTLMREWKNLDAESQSDSMARYRPEIMAFMSTITDVDITPEVIDNWSRSVAVARGTPAVDSVFPTREPISC